MDTIVDLCNGYDLLDVNIYETDIMLTLSTAHISEETASILDNSASLVLKHIRKENMVGLKI